MKTLQDQLAEAEAMVAAVRKQLEKEDEIKPIFPIKGIHYVLHSDAAYSCTSTTTLPNARIGSTFYSTSAVIAETKRRQAEVRVREAINEANKGDNGFKKSGRNYFITYTIAAHIDELFIKDLTTTEGNTWEAFREEGSARVLLNDFEFVDDWKLMKGIVT